MLRHDLWWDQNDTQIRYYSNVSYTHDQSSKDPNSENITTVNIPLIVSSCAGINQGREEEREGGEEEREGGRVERTEV